jgi:hypothetical protein
VVVVGMAWRFLFGAKSLRMVQRGAHGSSFFINYLHMNSERASYHVLLFGIELHLPTFSHHPDSVLFRALPTCLLLLMLGVLRSITSSKTSQICLSFMLLLLLLMMMMMIM